MNRYCNAVALAAIMAMCPAAMPEAFAGDDNVVTVKPASTDADAANGGVLYALPQTVLRVRLKARAVVSTAGPFFQHSARFLNRRDVVTANGVTWALVSADVETLGVPDYDNRFKVECPDPAKLPGVTMTQDGVICGFNVSSVPQVSMPANDVPTIAHADFSSVQLTRSVLTRTSTAAMAEDCANAIFNLRAMRLDLLSGAKEAQLPDAGSYAQVLAELDKQEREHVELFVGRRDTIYVERTIDILPDYNGKSNFLPIRFSESDGFVDEMDLTGKPVYVDIEFDGKTRVNELPATSKERQKAPLTGIRYIVPGLVTVRVQDRNILLCQKTVECAQNGQVATLPAAMLQTHSIAIDPASGKVVGISKLK